MSGLINLLTTEQLGLISNELERLFIFQDRPISKEKKAMMLQEIAGWGLPMGAIISGLRLMVGEDLKSIKIHSIRHAARSFISEEAKQKVSCNFCDRRGEVIMNDANKYEFSLTCICPNSISGLARWNGAATQISRGRLLRLRFSEFILDKK